MIIEPKDLKRLIVRVVAVTVALRAIHLFSVDLNAQEVAAAWALPGLHGTLAPLSHLVSAWREVCGGVAGLLRAPTLLADAALPLVAIGYARASGWGTLSGLMAGLLLAVGPLGLDEGWRADASTVLAALSFAATWTLRRGLRRGHMSAVIASWLLWAIAVALHPAALVAAPAGLWLTWRSVAMGRIRLVAALGWLSVFCAGFVWGAIGAMDQASEWLQDPSLNPGGVLWQADLASSWGTVRALGPAGASGALATLFDSAPAPQWRLWAGDFLLLLALVGLWVGRVQDDPAPQEPSTSREDGQQSQWRSVGVAHNVAPRILGERDWMPLLTPILAAVAWGLWAPHGAGVAEAVATARPFAAMLIGLGLTALCLRPVGAESLASAKRAVPALVLTALTLFGFGAHHTWVGTQRPSRMAPGKVARFVASYTADQGRVVCLGLRGLEVAWRLGPWPNTPRVVRTASELKSSLASVGSQLKGQPPWLVLVGDRWALEDKVDDGQAIGEALDAFVSHQGYTLATDGHRYLDQISVRVYEHGDDASSDSRATVRPQLYPGQAP